MDTVDWSLGRWTHPPVSADAVGGDLVVEAAEGSDAWRETSYGFVHDSEHALLAELPPDRAVEVTIVADFEAQFDQAGLFLTSGPTCWIKAGVEFADGQPMLGAVVTNPTSDWSVAPVPEWAGRRVTVRASRVGDAVTIRARVDDEPFRLVRLAPFPPGDAVAAGPLCCSPTRAGLRVRFTRWAVGPADAALH